MALFDSLRLQPATQPTTNINDEIARLEEEIKRQRLAAGAKKLLGLPIPDDLASLTAQLASLRKQLGGPTAAPPSFALNSQVRERTGVDALKLIPS
jgi:hypothetical protein